MTLLTVTSRRGLPGHAHVCRVLGSKLQPEAFFILALSSESCSPFLFTIIALNRSNPTRQTKAGRKSVSGGLVPVALHWPEQPVWRGHTEQAKLPWHNCNNTFVHHMGCLRRLLGGCRRRCGDRRAKNHWSQSRTEVSEGLGGQLLTFAEQDVPFGIPLPVVLNCSPAS